MAWLAKSMSRGERRGARVSVALVALGAPLLAASVVAQEPTPEPPPSASECQGELGTVAKVVDGSRLEVSLEGERRTVLLACVTAPQIESSNRLVGYLGPEAAALTRVLTEGKEVCLLADEGKAGPDSKGRLLRYVYLPDGSDLNGTLLVSGFGMFYPGHPCARAEEYRQLEQDARKRSAGLWDSDRRASYEMQAYGVSPVATLGAPSSELERMAAPAQMGRSGPYLLWSPVYFSYGTRYSTRSTYRIGSYYRRDSAYVTSYPTSRVYWP